MSKEMNEATFKAEVIDAKAVAMIDFWAPWCGPCRVMGPLVDNLSKKYEGKIVVAKVNVDENQNLAGQFNVMSIPTILFFKDGKVVHTHVGSTTEADLNNKIQQHLL